MIHDRRKKSRFGSYRAFDNSAVGGQNNYDEERTMVTFVQD